MEQLLNPLGAELRKLRQAKGISLGAFAWRLNLSVSFLRRVERGQWNPSLKTLHAMALALEVSVEELESLDIRPAVKARPAVKRLLALFERHPDYAIVFDLIAAKGVTPTEIKTLIEWWQSHQ